MAFTPVPLSTNAEVDVEAEELGAVEGLSSLSGSITGDTSSFLLAGVALALTDVLRDVELGPGTTVDIDDLLERVFPVREEIGEEPNPTPELVPLLGLPRCSGLTCASQ